MSLPISPFKMTLCVDGPPIWKCASAVHEVISDEEGPQGTSEEGAVQMDRLSKSIVHTIHHSLMPSP